MKGWPLVTSIAFGRSLGDRYVAIALRGVPQPYAAFDQS
jgi:hypothetical protein